METKKYLEDLINNEIKRKIEDAKEKSKKDINIKKTKIYQQENKEISREIIKSKKFLLDLIKKYEDEIFKNVELKLKDFTKTHEYKNYIINNIKKYFKKDDDIKILLTEKDFIYKNDILNEVDIDMIDIIISEKDFIGGFIGIIKNKNILLDFSFLSKLKDEREKFNEFKLNQEGGLL